MVSSRSVEALTLPPQPSTASERPPGSGYLRVPLKTRCSSRCERPACASSSRRDPTPTKRPTATERALGIGWVMTRSPLGSTLRSKGTVALARTLPAASPDATSGLLVVVARLGRHEQLHLNEAQVAGQLVRAARQGVPLLRVVGQLARGGGGELEHDPFLADDQGVDQQLVGGRVELEIVERVEV